MRRYLSIAGLEIVDRLDNLIDPDSIPHILKDFIHWLVGHGALVYGIL